MTTDFLVLGSGISGLIFALKVAAKGKVLILTKKESAESNTNYAQGGIASVLSPKDSPEKHIEDTLKAGDGLCNKHAVEIMVNEGPQRIKELESLGVRFARNPNGSYNLRREGGHSLARVAHVGDYTGFKVEKTLLDRVRSHPNIRIMQNVFVAELIVRDGTCYGVYVLEDNKLVPVTAGLTFLATGGAGQVYRYTTNPTIATGDGLAMAYRVGAEIANLEFVQFHPTTLYGYEIEGRNFLLTEALRGEGARLMTRDGRHFMKDYHPQGELAPRDIVSRAIYMEMQKYNLPCVYLDLSSIPKERLSESFPQITTTLWQLNINIPDDPVPVIPAAHYLCGGVKTDVWGRTNIVNLYAAGEVACTGVHGANRLASNSLLEALVFASRAAEHVLTEAARPEEKTFQVITSGDKRYGHCSEIKDELRRLMWTHVGILRNDRDLGIARDKILTWLNELEHQLPQLHTTRELFELRNMLTVAYLITESASNRKESRGLHYNVDHPSKDPRYVIDTVIIKPPSDLPVPLYMR